MPEKYGMLYSRVENFAVFNSRPENSVMLHSRAENFGTLYSTTQKLWTLIHVSLTYEVISNFLHYRHGGERPSWNRTITPTAHPHIIYAWKEAKADVREARHVELPPLSTINSNWITPALNSGHHEQQPANSHHTKQE
jgi:hypothetical protein